MEIKKYTKKLRVIPLGGLEQVGRNMMLIEYDRDIIIIDMGFQFPEEDMHGVDYIIPDISYLKNKENYIRGVLVTHGHMDHIGAIPHLIGKLGNPTIFSTKLTQKMIEIRQEEYKTKEKLNLYTINEKDKLQLGTFKVEFFRVNHNIPEVVGIVVHTPEGSIVHTGDFKFDEHPVNDKPADINKISEIGKNKVLMLCSDSTDAMKPGNAISEKTIGENLEEIFAEAKQRIIIATFSSLLSRIQQILNIAEKLKKKVAIEGFSLKKNVEIAKELGYLKIPKDVVISDKKIKNTPNNKLIILCTGAQGEENAVLMRIANKEHRTIKMQRGDTVIFSSSVIPGNENTVQKLKDSFTKEGAEIVHYKMMDIHAGGHGQAEDLKLMIKLINPKYFMPIHGNRYFLSLHGKLAEEMKIPTENIFIADNGQIMEFENGEGTLTKKKVPTNDIMVDGLGVGDVSNIVLRDRQMLAEDGMFVVIAQIDNKTGELVGKPDIISRGFVYMKESKKLIEQTRKKVVKILVDKDPKMAANDTYLRNKIRDSLGQFLFQKTQRRPMVLPVIISV